MANIENKDNKKEVKKRFVKALYSYVPVNNDELPLKVHDILEVIEETEEGWWKGILEGNVGMFPSNFVIELDGHPEEFNNKFMNELSPIKNTVKGKNVNHQEPMLRHGNNLLQANKENSKQSILNSSSGNDVDGTTSSKSHSELTTEKKIIPSKRPDSTAPRLPPKPVREQARALFPYEAQNEDELTLKEGDIITVISKEVEDKGWWKGELNNKVGVFPDNFVKVIKAEEQKKPERPDKPSTVITSKVSLRTNVSEKNSSESSPKHDKKIIKTPPAKPPPPELHKKDLERPLPPCPSKKPQPPHPVKKPIRVSVGTKLPGFSASPAIANLKSPISEISPPIPTYPPPSSEKIEDCKKLSENTPEKIEKITKSGEPEFDAIESSGKKLVHLTANRAKAPKRRPPSVIFLKENEKDSSVKATDSRRRSEPLLTEIESLFPAENKEALKTSAISNLEQKPKAPPQKPFFPPFMKTSSSIKSSTTTIVKGSSLDETTTNCLEAERKDFLSEIIPQEVAPVIKNKIILQPALDSSVDHPVNAEPIPNREDISVQNNIAVTRKEFNELVKQVKDLKEMLEMYKNHSKRAISDLKAELEEERKLRRSVETDLQKWKEAQST